MENFSRAVAAASVDDIQRHGIGVASSDTSASALSQVA
jgi:hypothetical protein